MIVKLNIYNCRNLQPRVFYSPSPPKKKKDIEEKRKATYSEVKGLMVSVKSWKQLLFKKISLCINFCLIFFVFEIQLQQWFYPLMYVFGLDEGLKWEMTLALKCFGGFWDWSVLGWAFCFGFGFGFSSIYHFCFFI